jgi:hypothetical protein
LQFLLKKNLWPGLVLITLSRLPHMKKLALAIFLFGVSCLSPGYGQSFSINRASFFSDTSVIQATIVANMDKILTNHRKKEIQVPGIFKTSIQDKDISDTILIRVRGNFRLEYCYVPPIRLKFNYKDSASLRSLKSLDLVSACKSSSDFEQFLLKEYLIYRIYNILTEKSFRTRLLHLNILDSSGKKKPVYIYAFLLEDVKDLAKRNGYKEWGKGPVKASAIDHQQVTMVSVFEYMIGNIDWGLSPNHNVKTIASLKDSIGGLGIVPYDFDYSGLVNATYAVSNDPELENVKQRKYIGLSRTPSELEETLSVFRQRKSQIYDLVNHFELLSSRSRKEIIDYLDEFYNMINHPDQVKSNLAPAPAQ